MERGGNPGHLDGVCLVEEILAMVWEITTIVAIQNTIVMGLRTVTVEALQRTLVGEITSQALARTQTRVDTSGVLEELVRLLECGIAKSEP